MRDFSPTSNITFNPDFAPISREPIRYGVMLEIGETAFGEYRSFTCLTVDLFGYHAAEWMA